MANEKDEGRMLIALNALIDGQRRTLHLIETAIERYSAVETEISKLNREINVSHELMLRNHGDISLRFDTMQERQGSVINRLDAIAARFEEIERIDEDRASDIKKLRIELISQYNDILSAPQLASNSMADTKEFHERLEQIERRLGL